MLLGACTLDGSPRMVLATVNLSMPLVIRSSSMETSRSPARKPACSPMEPGFVLRMRKSFVMKMPSLSLGLSEGSCRVISVIFGTANDGGRRESATP